MHSLANQASPIQAAPELDRRSETHIWDDDSDEDLFEAYRCGNERAFDVLYGRYRSRIEKFFRHRLMDEERCLDLLQETFLRVHRARHQFNDQWKFSTWIGTIAKNLLKNEYGRLSRTSEINFSGLIPADGAPTGETFEFAADSVEPDYDVYRSELRRAIEHTLSRLSEHHRTPLLMKEEGFSFQEIAQQIGIPTNTAKSRVIRGRAAFRALFPIPSDFIAAAA
jgi:RNA polymerase sigma-70 factor (ECF subfamily)